MGNLIAGIAKTAIRDVTACRYLPKDVVGGVKVAKQYAQRQNFGVAKSIGCQSHAVASRVNKHLPGIFAGASLPTPIPTPLGYGFGKILQKIISKIL
jgi:hypothetical protein